MQTTISDQINAIKYARKYVNDGNQIALSLSLQNEIDKGLNDAGATLAALNIALSRFQGRYLSQTDKAIIALEFFTDLNQSV